ncbi:MAG: HEAT repeat domain-containing protein [Gemmatimonadaceae bacterium]|nr:HEAT repeat domain-containing protein [Gemmatimonadaceae bacterium]
METITKMALAWLLTYAIHSTVLLSAAWLVSRFTRLSIHTVDFIWKVALIGGLVTSSVQLALDVRPSGSFALQSVSSVVSDPSIEAVNSDIGHPAAAIDDHATSVSDGPATPGSAITPSSDLVAPSVAANAEDVSAPFISRVMIERFLVIGWAFIALMLALTYTARRLMLVGRLANRQHITDGALPAMLDALCRTVGFRSHVALTSVNTISSPVALGLREICVPEAALTELTTDEQRGLLAHELAHLARRDPVWLDMASIMERVFFFQPLNRLARREIQRNAEFLCDDWAAERTGNGLPLAHCLARVAEWIEASPLGVPVAGMAEQRSLLVTRIARLIEGKRTGSPLSRALTIGAGTVMLATVVAAAPAVRTSNALIQSSAETPLLGNPVSENRLQQPVDTDGENLPTPQSGATDTSRERLEAAKAKALVNLALQENRKPADHQGKQSLVEDPAVIAALIDRLRDSDASVRRAAANALGNLESKTAVPALMAIIGDANKEVRQAVCEALGNIGDARAVPALTRALRDAVPEVRHQAIEALSEFADELDANQITPFIQDSRPAVRAKAAELLGEIGDRSAASALQNLLGDTSPEVRTAALESLCEIKAVLPAREVTALLTDGVADVRRAALEYVKEQPSLADVSLIQKMLEDSDGHVREQAVETLAELRSTEARTALRGALTSTDPVVRRRAAEALGNR